MFYDILKTTPDVSTDPLTSDTTADSLDPDPDDVWLFTDPTAKAVYARQGRLELLEQDIMTHVMYAGRWAPEELELKSQIQCRLRERVLIPKGSFVHVSPHSSVYWAVHDGALHIGGQKFHYVLGDEIAFAPWLMRVHTPSLQGPVRIARFRAASTLHLCCDVFPNVGQLCERALAVLHDTLPRPRDRRKAGPRRMLAVKASQ